MGGGGNDATLLQLCVRALGAELCYGSTHVAAARLGDIPEAELALQVFVAWQEQLAAAGSGGIGRQMPPPLLARQLEVLRGFAAAFWRPVLLRLAYDAAPTPLPPGLAHLPLVGRSLLHLELCAPGLQRLDEVASACPNLLCLSLRGCTRLGDAALVAALGALPSLRALDCGGLPGVGDTTCWAAARRLPQLQALNLGGCPGVGDASLDLLTYGHRVRGWWRAAQQQQQQQAIDPGDGGASVAPLPLPSVAADWPAVPLAHLQLAGTRVGAAGVAQLLHLDHLRFLDVRHTGVDGVTLGPLARRFGLQIAQPGVLTASIGAAVAVVNMDAVVCRCGDAVAAASARLLEWEAAGVQGLLHCDPTAAATVEGLAAVMVRQQPDAEAGSLAAEGWRPGYRRRQLPGERDRRRTAR